MVEGSLCDPRPIQEWSMWARGAGAGLRLAGARGAGAGAALDPALREQFARGTYKPRRHPGVSRLRSAALPGELARAAELVLREGQASSLGRAALELDDYLRSRHAPPEPHELERAARELHGHMRARRVPEGAGEAERERLRREHDLKVFRQLKKRVYHWANVAYNRSAALQYLLVRAAPEYAVLCRVLGEIDAALPDYEPRSFFDFGSGVGTGTWAVNRYWREHIFEYFCVDTSPDMHDLARLILCDGRDNVELPLKGFFQRQFLPASSNLKYNIVLSAYTLFEMPSARSRLETIQKLWNKTEDFLIIVEQGTNAGFRLVNEAREFVLNMPEGKKNGYVFAPCPNDSVCPRYLEQKTPCNFLMRYETLPYPSKPELKAELFSYVILRKGSRPPDDRQWPRIVRAPIVRKKHTICRMCTAQGELKEVIFTKRKHDQDTYRCARASCWGDLLPVMINKMEPENEENTDADSETDHQA